MNDSFFYSNKKAEVDTISSYFECITECNILHGNKECVTRCVEIYLKGENQNE